MARKTASRLDKRREMEAAEQLEATSTGKKATKKKAAKKKTTRKKKVKAPARMRLVWVVYAGNMKEEARFRYDQRDEAEAKIEHLRSKSKKLYFIQPVKEPIEGPAPRAVEEDVAEVEAASEEE